MTFISYLQKRKKKTENMIYISYLQKKKPY
jgi:hypothetical protein